MKFESTVSTVFVLSVLLVGLSGCQKKEDQAALTVHENQVELTLNKGSAENAGQEIDKAATKVGEKIEQAGEKIQDAANGDKD
jgi:uncharacterized lipoprotein YehR (DUF1307 family)